jgi:enoyl-CoA hydratase/carnithine racemase
VGEGQLVGQGSMSTTRDAVPPKAPSDASSDTPVDAKPGVTPDAAEHRVSEGGVEYEKRGRIAYITLARPRVRNAIDPAMNAELWRIWRDFAEDTQLDVAILTGRGEAFCAGADLKEYIPVWLGRSMADVRANVATGLGGITRGLHKISKPIIAAVNGWALAGGFELALACDIRIASTEARFGSFEVRRGFHHGDGGIVRLVAIAGMGRALDIVLTGREVSASEAERMGLVSQVVAPDQLMRAAEECAARLLANSQSALRSAKETILDVVGRSLDDALRLEAINGYSSADPLDVQQRLSEFFRTRREDP